MRTLATLIAAVAFALPFARADEVGRCPATRLDLSGVEDASLRADLAAFDLPPDAEPEFAWSAVEGRSRTDWPVLDVTFPSPHRSGLPENDVVHCRYYVPRRRSADARVPAAIVLHHLGGDFVAEAILAEYLAKCGVAAMEVEFPFYGPRRPIGPDGQRRDRRDIMASGDMAAAVAATRQAVADVRRAADWLAARPEIDAERIGCVGVSLGGILGSVVAGVDPRFRRNVLVIAGGDLPMILLHESRETRRLREAIREKGLTREELAAMVRPIEPLRYAPRIAPGTTLMLNASKDEVIPRAATEALWEAAGRPEIVWYPTGHPTIAAFFLELFGKTRDHFLAAADATVD